MALMNVLTLMKCYDNDITAVSNAINRQYQRGICTLDEMSDMLEVCANLILMGVVNA